MARKGLVRGEIDRRIIEQMIRHQEVTKEELEKAVASLPDVGGKSEFVKAPRQEEKKPGRSGPSDAD